MLLLDVGQLVSRYNEKFCSGSDLLVHLSGVKRIPGQTMTQRNLSCEAGDRGERPPGELNASLCKQTAGVPVIPQLQMGMNVLPSILPDYGVCCQTTSLHNGPLISEVTVIMAFLFLGVSITSYI